MGRLSDGFGTKKIRKNTDGYFYGVEKGKSFIGVDGWFFATDGAECRPVAKVNDEVCDAVIKRKSRPDVNEYYGKKYKVQGDVGYETRIYIDKAATESVSIEVESGGKSFEVFRMDKRLINKKIKKYLESSADIVYCLDEKKLGKKGITLSGWVVDETSDRAVEITVLDSRKRKIEAELTRTRRRDIFRKFEESCDPVSGFVLKFPYHAGGRYFLVFTSGKERTIVKLELLRIFLSKFRRKQRVRKSISYKAWLKKNHITKGELDAQRAHTFAYSPLISIVIPLYETDEKFFCQLVDSILNQTYQNFEICFADGSATDRLKTVIEKNYPHENRIRYQKLEKNLLISGNTNAAIEMARGEYIVFADHDDILELHALYEMVSALNQDRSIDVVYTDEDKTNFANTKYFEPHFKPDFSIDLLRSVNYICHLFMVKKELADEVGYLRDEFNGAQDYDFVLRCCEKAKKIYHVPKALYHWRSHEKSTAGNPESKLYAFEAGKRAIEAHYKRVGIEAEVELTPNLGLYRSRFAITGNPLVSIIIPNKDHIDDLDKCIQSVLKKSTYGNYEIVIVENNSELPETFAYYRKIEEKENVRVIYWDKEFNYSAINNFGVREAKGEYLLLLNNDTEIISENWIEEMLGYCQREDVGAVGARLYYADDTIQHAGVILGFGGIAGHAAIGQDRDETGYMARALTPQDVSIVTAACMMVDRKVFDEVGGLDERLKVAFNDVDFCMKVREKGYLVVYNPYAELYHYESKSRGMEDTPEKVARFAGEIEIFKKRWEKELQKGDPYYNPNLSLKRADYSLRGEDEKVFSYSLGTEEGRKE